MAIEKKDLTPEDLLRHQINQLDNMDKELRSINGKLTFFTILIVIGLVISILQACGSVLGLS